MIAGFTQSDGSVKKVSYKQEAYIPLDQNLIVPPKSAGNFVQLKHWDELGRGDNKKPFPEMFTPALGLRLEDPSGRVYEYVELERPYQQLLWDWWKHCSQYRLPTGEITGYYQRPNNDRIFAHTTPGSLTYVWVDMVEAHRAFTEAASPEAGARDQMTKRNMSNPRDFEWLFDPTCGAMLRVLSTAGTDYVIEAIDILKPPPTIESIAARPWLSFWCTQWGKYEGSTRFPQIKIANAVHGLPPQGISSLLLSKGGTIRVKKTSCNILVNGAPWTPYAPK